MKNNGFSSRPPRRNLTVIIAVYLIIFILTGIGCAASQNGSIAERENPCNGTGAPEHCIPSSYWMNAGTMTTLVESLPPSPQWSDMIGEYQARVGISGDGRSIVTGSDTGTLRMYDRSGKVLWTVSFPHTSVYAVATSGDGEHVAASLSDPTKPSDENEWQIRYFDRAGNRSGLMPTDQRSTPSR